MLRLYVDVGPRELFDSLKRVHVLIKFRDLVTAQTGQTSRVSNGMSTRIPGRGSEQA
jgi:hypothetical protein